MPARHPQTDTIVRLYNEGHTQAAVADMLGIKEHSVANVLRRVRDHGGPVERRSTAGRPRNRLAVRLSSETRETLRRQAQDRMMTENQLITAVLTTVIMDDLFKAVLED